MLRSVWDRYSFYYWISKCFLHQLISFSHCHFLSNLVDRCCFQQNTCAHKKNLITHNWRSGTGYTLWFVTHPDTVIKIMPLCITVYLVCESNLNILSLDFVFIPYLIFNSALSRVVTLPECPCRLLTSTEVQRISYVITVCVVQPFGAKIKCPVGTVEDWNLNETCIRKPLNSISLNWH